MESRRPPKATSSAVWFDPIDETTWRNLCTEWGIDPARMPRETILVRREGVVHQNFSQRPTESPNRLTLVSPAVVRLLDLSHARGGALHLVQLGLAAFHRASRLKAGETGTPHYRITQDGAMVLRSLVTKRIFDISLEHVAQMRDSVVHVAETKDEEGARQKKDWTPSVATATLSPASRDVAQNASPGGLLMRLTPEDQQRFAEAMGGILVFAAWRGMHSSNFVSLMVQRQEMSELWRQMEEAGLLPRSAPPASS